MRLKEDSRRRFYPAKAGLLRRIVTGYLIVVGVFAHIAVIIGFIAALKYFQLTPNQLLVRAVEKSPINMPGLVEAIAPAPRFSDHILDGRIRVSYPRIVLPELSGWSGQGMPDLIAQRIALYSKIGILDFDPCKPSSDILMLSACWVSQGDQQTASQLIENLKQFKQETPTASGNYQYGWQLAFAYNLIANYSGLSQNDRVQIETKIEQLLQSYLRLLDDPSPSLWHGRASLASIAWLNAVTLNATPEDKHRYQLIARAQGHFLDVIKALEITEGWPEGFNYWIQNRGFIISLAASAYVNGLTNSQHTERVVYILKRIGLWHIYATRPDNRIENLGDEGSRVDLKDETRRVIDIIAQTTREPVFVNYSNYLQQLHGAESYFHGYRWGIRLFNDPTIANTALTRSYEVLRQNTANLNYFETQIPLADLFGRGGLNQAYIRSDWSPEATFISFRAGHIFTHHGHYDAGHFTIFKGAPLAINSSAYGEYFGANRLNYSIRTVAKNSLLILRPHEKVQPNRFFEQNVSDGGQRIVFPTGSAVQSVNDWRRKHNAAPYLSGGKINHFHTIDREYTYISSDLTNAYNTPAHDEGGRGGKVNEVKRDLVYLANEDRVLVYDRVVSTDPSYTKKWLLHTVNQPQVKNATALKGELTNGISETTDSVALIKNDSGHLRIDRIYPEDAKIRLVGGPDYQYYVESDGDETVLDGENFSSGASFHPWFDIGMWRIEVQPGAPRLRDEFLIVLSPSLNAPRADKPNHLLINGMAAKGIETAQNIVVFAETVAHGEFEIISGSHLSKQKQRTLYVFGMPIGMQVKVNYGAEERIIAVNSSGVLVTPLNTAAARIALSW
ncbi:MAG: hypothetical protein H6937_08655 [Burkholderiales bacterium]|nr:hypothetical protein [Burkholderiales bacterium]MDR4517171.1 hypothetical protein [Nitrosomonas sp.]